MAELKEEEEEEDICFAQTVMTMAITIERNIQSQVGRKP